MHFQVIVFILFISKLGTSAVIPEEETFEEEDEIYILVRSLHQYQRSASGRVIKGNDCEYIKLNSITANSGCTDGMQDS